MLARVLPLVFLSGACALTQELAWMRELKLVFGFSTAASATVLGAFSAGLGFGALVLGRIADRARNPLRVFALLEGGIGLWAAAVPLLLDLVRAAYVAAGGTPALGLGAGTLLRLALSFLVLGGPAFFMGGTLPAVAKALEDQTAAGRHRSALLYGTNTLGAVAGCVLPTFLLFEALGTRATIWAFACLNVLVAVTANALARRVGRAPEGAQGADSGGATTSAAALAATSGASSGATPAATSTATSRVTEPGVGVARPSSFSPALVGVAAFASGFCFFFMELVWYRMLGPILGGTTFTFGLILAVALAGIGLGGLAYGLFRDRVPVTLGTFATTCLLEAFFLGLPFALGDHVAIAAEILRRGAYLGFPGQVLGWSVVAGFVVGPAALIAGFQFPLFIALLGSGASRLGLHVGFAYVTNTLGSLVGSLLGGFVLLPSLGALGSWRLVVWTLVAVALLVSLAGRRGTRAAPRPPVAQRLAPAVAAVVVVAITLGRGPTAAWRHGGIGAGRARLPTTLTETAVREWMARTRATIVEQIEGREAAIGIDGADGYAFLVNGKSDGHALLDAATQMGLGLLPSILHAEPRRALVVGLGTGSTAGWLGAIAGMERVDVAELEPAIVRVAELCAPVNERVLENPKVKLHFGDARELLLVTRDRYDLIVSEPSNPFRAGIASLYTREFFEAAASRLRRGGLFVQWLQAYEVDAVALGSTLATMYAVFPHVEAWFGAYGDFFLVASAEPLRHDADRIRRRLAEPPWRAGFLWAWGATEPEGVFAHFAGGPVFTKQVAQRTGRWINTDDLNGLEYGFARTLGKTAPKELTREVLAIAEELRAAEPAVTGTFDQVRVAELRFAHLAEQKRAGQKPPAALARDEAARARLEALDAFRAARYADVRGIWDRQSRPPASPQEIFALTYARALDGALAAGEVEGDFWRAMPADRAFALAVSAARQKKIDEALSQIRAALAALRERPFASRFLLANVLRDAVDRAKQASKASQGAGAGALRQMFEALNAPFAVNRLESDRRAAVLDLIDGTPLWRERCAAVLAPFEPGALWTERHLERRRRCYADTGHRLAAVAERDLAAYRSSLLTPLGAFTADAPEPEEPQASSAAAAAR